MELLSP